MGGRGVAGGGHADVDQIEDICRASRVAPEEGQVIQVHIIPNTFLPFIFLRLREAVIFMLSTARDRVAQTTNLCIITRRAGPFLELKERLKQFFQANIAKWNNCVYCIHNFNIFSIFSDLYEYYWEDILLKIFILPET